MKTTDTMFFGFLFLMGMIVVFYASECVIREIKNHIDEKLTKKESSPKADDATVSQE
jgi:hypothetical protein